MKPSAASPWLSCAPGRSTATQHKHRTPQRNTTHHNITQHKDRTMRMRMMTIWMRIMAIRIRMRKRIENHARIKVGDDGGEDKDVRMDSNNDQDGLRWGCHYIAKGCEWHQDASGGCPYRNNGAGRVPDRASTSTSPRLPRSTRTTEGWSPRCPGTTERSCNGPRHPHAHTAG